MPMRQPAEHPGEVLFNRYMKPRGITGRQLASHIEVSPSRISELINGARPVTVDTALRLSEFFKTNPRFWLEMQINYDLFHATPPGIRRPAD